MEKKIREIKIRVTDEEFNKLRWLSIVTGESKSSIMRSLLHKKFIDQVSKESKSGRYEAWYEFLKKHDERQK